MTVARLKTAVWVQAQVRLCDAAFIPVAVARRGDPDAGAVLIKLVRPGEGCQVLAQAYTAEGERAWLRGTGPEPVDETVADAYITRQVRIDPDLWVLEIEDRAGRYALDGRIV
jgi:hypothetical protein